MKVAFVSGPYRANTVSGIVHNIKRAEKVAVELWRMGYAVICPHKNSALFDGLCDDSVWLKGDLELLHRCDCVVLVPGWSRSKGSITERAEAIRLGIPVFSWVPENQCNIKQFLQEESNQK